eukprot:6024625-Amphidinium_carterae.1
MRSMLSSWASQSRCHRCAHGFLALWCHSGRHRSVFMTEAVFRYLMDLGADVTIVHEDKSRWPCYGTRPTCNVLQANKERDQAITSVHQHLANNVNAQIVALLSGGSTIKQESSSSAARERTPRRNTHVEDVKTTSAAAPPQPPLRGTSSNKMGTPLARQGVQPSSEGTSNLQEVETTQTKVLEEVITRLPLLTPAGLRTCIAEAQKLLGEGSTVLTADARAQLAEARKLDPSGDQVQER